MVGCDFQNCNKSKKELWFSYQRSRVLHPPSKLSKPLSLCSIMIQKVPCEYSFFFSTKPLTVQITNVSNSYTELICRKSYRRS